MGIQNLLPNLASIAQDKSLAEYAGKSAAIDGYSWLHKASTCCAQELCLGVPSGTDKLIKSVMKKIEMLRRHRVEPYMVFDGAPLPAKAGTEQERLLGREKNLVKARAFLSQGNAAQANLHFQKAVDISPSMVRDLIVHLKAASVDYVVAPYEADAQLAFLEREQLVDFVISEDSDMLAWNCKRVLFKLDHEGCGKEIQIADLPRSTELNFTNWTLDMFTSMCILCGCDYVDSIKGVGVKKAHALMRENKTIENIMRRLRLDGALAIPHNYVDAFQLAFSTFRHQVVFDPRTREAVHFTPLSDRMRERYPACGELDFLGELLSKEVACGIADGTFDPMTRAPFATSLRIGGASTSSSSSQYRPSVSASSVKHSIMMASWLHSAPSAHENRSHNLPPVPESSPMKAAEQSDPYFAHHLKGPSTFCLSDSRPAAPVGSTGRRSSAQHLSVPVQSVYFQSTTSSVVLSSADWPASELIRDDAPADGNANVECIPEAIATASPFAVSCDVKPSGPCLKRSSETADVFARMDSMAFSKRSKVDALAAPAPTLPVASYSGAFAPLLLQEPYRASPIVSASNRLPFVSREAHAPPKSDRVSLPPDSKSNSRRVLGDIDSLHELPGRRSFHGVRVGADAAGLDAFKYSRVKR